MLHQIEKLEHINSIAHEGKTLVFATTADGEIHYTVKQDGFEDTYLNTPAEERIGWEKWKMLEFPDEEKNDQSVVDREKAELTYSEHPDLYVLRSHYRTQEMSAVAPVQLVSAQGHIYVFRQSKSNTLFVDRFILDGMTNQLNRKLEVRFKRSRQRHKPTENMNKGAGGLTNIDTLDFRDANNNFFYEPTTELCFVENMQDGWFSVVLVPTFENDVYRWHIFAYNSQTEKVELSTVRASGEGLFDVKDYTVLEKSKDRPVPRNIPGLIRRTFVIEGNVVTNGLAATKYDLQQEQETQSGEKQLLRTATRLMLAIPTDKGTAALSFAIAGDGTLAQIRESPERNIIRSQQREILLPLTTLDEIKAFSDASPKPKGTVSGLTLGTNSEDAEDLVKISTENAAGLKNRDRVKITHTQHLQGLYRATKVDDDTFAIDDPSVNGDSPSGEGLGYWEKQEEAAGGLVFDGMITAYERTDDAKLQVTCPRHGLNDGDEVQISGTEAYNSSYPVKKIDDTHFVIERKWATGEAVNVNLVSRKRRGTHFNGSYEDYIEIPHAPELSLDVLTIEAWVNPNETQANGSGSTIVSKWHSDFRQSNYQLIVNSEMKICLNCDSQNGGSIATTGHHSLKPGVWSHIAVTWDGRRICLYLDDKLDYSENYTTHFKNVQGNGPLIFSTPFAGKIADVRIWNQARSVKEIKDSMYLQLTGKEAGLVGYWRLGAITERKVIDFSVNGNDGTVHGDPYVSAVTLDRKLGKNTGERAVMYRNDELFAVSERATYVETFEFKVNATGNGTPHVTLAYLDNADGKGNKIFSPSFWGKASRSAEEKKEIPSPMPYEFTVSGGGWFRASCTVTPNGVGMLRAFEIDDIRGEWESLEIRKHRITLVSDCITEERFTDKISLTTLADDQSALDALKELDNLEKKEGGLVRDKRRLEMLIDSANALGILEQDVKAAKAEFDRSQHDYEYWSLEKSRSALVTDLAWSKGRWNGTDYATWAKQEIGYYKWPGKWSHRPDRSPICKGLQFITHWPTHFYLATSGRNTNKESISGKLITSEKARNKAREKLQKLETELANFKREHKRGPDGMKGRLERVEAELVNLNKQIEGELVKDSQDNLVTVTEGPTPLYTKVLTGVADARKSTHGMSHLHKDKRGLETKGALLGFVRPASRLSTLETSEGKVQLSYFDAAGRMRQTNYDATADSANSCFEQWLPDGLRSCINFNQSDSGITLPAEKPIILREAWTIEAWVSFPLAGPDNQGEESQRTYWTSVAGSAEGLDGYIVTEYDPGRDTEFLGIRVGGQFQSSGYDLTQVADGWHHVAAVAGGGATVFYIDGKQVSSYPLAENLTKARKVAQESSLDGRRLADARQKLKEARLHNDQHAIRNFSVTVTELEKSDETIGEADKIAAARSDASAKQPREPITTLGATTGAKPFGKVAELRIWKVALPEEEINVNSKTLLSGNEPGLLAYYPMDEASGSEVRDHTKNGHGVTVEGLKWWGCAAPIGLIDHESTGVTKVEPASTNATKFDGQDDFVEIADSQSLHFGASTDFTIELWVKTSKRQDDPCLISNKDWDSYKNKGFAIAAKNEKWMFNIGDGTNKKDLENIGVLNDGQWHHLAVTVAREGAEEIIAYQDGIEGARASAAGIGVIDSGLGLKIAQDGTGKYSFKHQHHWFQGQIADVRIWKAVRTPLEIEDTRFKRLTGIEQDLVAYYPLDEIKEDEGTIRKVLDLTANKNDGIVMGATSVEDDTLSLSPSADEDDSVSSEPTGADALVSSEYSTVVIHSITKRKSAIMRRFFSFPAADGVELLPDKRIEALDLKWIGNAQFAPTLLGFIEGAPPVPSENLTLEEDYNGATSIELAESDDVSFSWGRSEGGGLGASAEVFAGSDAEASAGFGFSTTVAKVRSGFKGNMDTSYQVQKESRVASSSSLSMTDKLELRGTPEETAKFPHLGRRFIPKNVGYALVVSALADVFVTRLARSGRMVGYQVQPVDGIPPDVNTITFLMNPAYTMNGSLDGMTGSSATSDRFFKHVPEMRSQHGSLYPASYYRLQEAYDLKQQIEAEDKRREAYFSNFDARLVDEASLERNVKSGNAPTAIGFNQVEGETDTEMTEEEKRKAEEEKAKNTKAGAEATVRDRSAATEKKQAEIQSKISDQEKRMQATHKLAGWRKQMENIQIRAGKRNIVNTYVWDADGGLRTEAQSFASTVEHTIGGSFSLDLGFGYEGKFAVSSIAVELTAQATVSLTQTMSKTQSRSKGFELNVDLGGLEHRGITNYDDKPILPGEKVDRYRFMSFYLEGTTRHFQDFFNYVVDPEWLASNDEEARALRQTQSGKPNKTWRVLHRVTYVERPALMGFGRDVRKLRAAAEKSEHQELLLDQIKKLTEYNRNLEATLNQILDRLPASRQTISPAVKPAADAGEKELERESGKGKKKATTAAKD